MKRLIITLSIACIAFYGFSQENLLSISGGYAFANVDDSEYFTEDPNIKGSGWRINGTYDFNRNEGPIAYGFSVGYISVSADYSGAADTLTEYTINTVPFYFAPKYLFGNETFRGFIKLAIGAQSANLKRTTPTAEITANDFGFYGGAGAGIMINVHEMIFLNVEYEIAYMQNNYYRNGMMQTVMGGIGVRF